MATGLAPPALLTSGCAREASRALKRCCPWTLEVASCQSAREGDRDGRCVERRLSVRKVGRQGSVDESTATTALRASVEKLLWDGWIIVDAQNNGEMLPRIPKCQCADGRNHRGFRRLAVGHERALISLLSTTGGCRGGHKGLLGLHDGCRRSCSYGTGRFSDASRDARVCPSAPTPGRRALCQRAPGLCCPGARGAPSCAATLRSRCPCAAAG